MGKQNTIKLENNLFHFNTSNIPFKIFQSQAILHF